jgi:hypothetical protein
LPCHVCERTGYVRIANKQIRGNDNEYAGGAQN